LSNPFSKLLAHQLPGNLFGSIISEDSIIIESRTNDQLHFSAINLLTGTLTYECASKMLTAWHRLVGAQNRHLIVQHFDNRKNPDVTSYFAFDPTQDLSLGEIDVLPKVESYVNPDLYMAQSEDFGLFQQFIDDKIVLGCEYQEVDNKMIISYYVPSNNEYTRRLRILADRKIVYDEVQDEGMKGFAPGSFFTLKNRLIFVRNKREFTIYEI
jgi:hypothetical protein